MTPIDIRDEPFVTTPPRRQFTSNTVLSAFRHYCLGSPSLYLISATLVLYGIHLLWQDTAMVSESEHLQVSMLSLHLYEVLLVATSIALAYRGIRYDSLLLTALEMLFMLIPFVLLSTATWLDIHSYTLTGWICGMGFVLAGTKLATLSRFHPYLQLSRRFLLAAVIIVTVNMALPILFRVMADTNVKYAAMQRHTLWLIHWRYALPILAVIPFCLGRQAHRLLYIFYGVWLAVTGYHLWALSYVYDWGWSPVLIVPSLWVLAHLIYDRHRQLIPTAHTRALRLLSWMPLTIVWLSGSHNLGRAVFVMSVINVAIYVARWCRTPTGQHQFQSLVATLTVIASLPVREMRLVLPAFERTDSLLLAGGLLVMLVSLRVYVPSMGFAAAVTTYAASTYVGSSVHIGLQLAFVYVLTHSLRWSTRPVYCHVITIVRSAAALCWVVHTLVWLHFDYGFTAIVGSSGLAGFLLGAVTLLKAERRAAESIIYAATGVWVLQPLYTIMDMVVESGPGMWLVVSGLGLFGLGTLSAWNKPPFSAPSPLSCSDVLNG